MNVKMRSLVVVLFFSIVASVVSAAEGKIIAVYGDSMKQKEPVPGWSYLWNAKGDIGKAANYAPFTKDGGFSTKTLISGKSSEWWRLGRPQVIISNRCV